VGGASDARSSCTRYTYTRGAHHQRCARTHTLCRPRGEALRQGGWGRKGQKVGGSVHPTGGGGGGRGGGLHRRRALEPHGRQLDTEPPSAAQLNSRRDASHTGGAALLVGGGTENLGRARRGSSREGPTCAPRSAPKPPVGLAAAGGGIALGAAAARSAALMPPLGEKETRTMLNKLGLNTSQ
jgi:hypothetical protein